MYRAFLAADTGSVSEENCVVRGKSRTGACRFLEELGKGEARQVAGRVDLVSEEILKLAVGGINRVEEV